MRRLVLTLVPLIIGCAANPGLRPIEEFPRSWFWGLPQDLARWRSMVGQPMPSLHLSDWRGDKPDLKNKILVLEFWATWCPPCIESVPHNNALQSRFHERGIEVIGICTSADGQEIMEAFADRHGIQYPIARDPDQKTATAFGVTTFPVYALIDRQSRVRGIGLRRDAVPLALDRVLNERQP